MVALEYLFMVTRCLLFLDCGSVNYFFSSWHDFPQRTFILPGSFYQQQDVPGLNSSLWKVRIYRGGGVLSELRPALKPIDVATGARTVIIPHVLERKRPTTSDHASTMILSMLWVSLGHVVNVSFACKAQGSLSTTSHSEFLLRSSGKPGW